MKTYLPKIQLVKNGRGVWCLDTTVGCNSGLSANPRGCYGDCYAARSAKLRGFDFSKTVERVFESKAHEAQILKKLNRIPESFVRIGCSGDPSENWCHTLEVIDAIKTTHKSIIIITRHWQLLTDFELEFLADVGVCINTSVSALDSTLVRDRCLHQYNRIKPYCDSVLRVVTCDFNTETVTGARMAEIQESLLSESNVIDTVFRPSKSNPLVKSGIIRTERAKFMSSSMLVSMKNKRAYLGHCGACTEKCGAAFFASRPNPQTEMAFN